MFFSYKIDNEITLKEPMEFYSEDFRRGIIENFDYLTQFCGFPADIQTKEGAIKTLEEYRTINRNLTGLHSLIIVDGKLAGSFQLNKFNLFNCTTEFGYWLFADFQGKGIISRCCEAMLDYSFNELNFNRIEIKCAVTNIKSQKIPKKFGFKEEGILRENEWLNGKFSDLILFSLLKSEWKNKKD